MPPLGSIFRSATGRPKVDQHSLFTSIQVSVPVLQCNLQVYEPWKKKRVKPKLCQVTLYSNETSPFLVWSKIINSSSSKSPRTPVGLSPGMGSPEGPGCGKPRCVVPVSRAKVTKTTGGCFEVVDFATSALFRFVAPTIYESEMWVKQLKKESQREANLDMGSICSSCSSSSSCHASPVSNEYTGFSVPTPSTPNAFSQSGHLMLSNASSAYPNHAKSIGNYEEREGDFKLDRPTELRIPEEMLTCETSDDTGSLARAQLSTKQRHTRAQPHLGSNVHTVEKHRPDLNRFLHDTSTGLSTGMETRRALPFSEYFVNLPET